MCLSKISLMRKITQKNSILNEPCSGLTNNLMLVEQNLIASYELYLLCEGDWHMNCFTLRLER